MPLLMASNAVSLVPRPLVGNLWRCSDGSSELQVVKSAGLPELSLAQAKEDLMRIYFAFDGARASRMAVPAAAASTVLSALQRRDAAYESLVPVQDDWEEAVRRGIPLAVILRFTLWAYEKQQEQQQQQRERCYSPSSPESTFGLSSMLDMKCDARADARGQSLPSPTTAPAAAESEQRVKSVRSKEEPGHEEREEGLQLMLPESDIMGACLDRGDWLEVLAVFAPPSLTAALLRRAVMSNEARSGCCGGGGDMTFLAWRHRAAPAAEHDEYGDATAAVDVLGTNSARHGAAHPRSAFRPPTSATQLFLFHGELHSLHHAEGMAWRVGDKAGPACVCGSDACGGSNENNSSYVSASAGGVGDVLSSQGNGENTDVSSCGGDWNWIEEQQQQQRQVCVEVGTDSSMDAIVNYAEALLLPALNTRAACSSEPVPRQISDAKGDKGHEETKRKTTQVSRNDASSTISATEVAIPESLMCVCDGAFCLPKCLPSDTLRYWGFVSVVGDQQPSDGSSGCSKTNNIEGGNDIYCYTDGANDDADVYAAVNRHLPLSVFTERLCSSVLSHHHNGSAGVAVPSWWPLEMVPDGHSNYVVSDEDDDDDDGGVEEYGEEARRFGLCARALRGITGPVLQLPQWEKH
ncbi:hypothetical protein DQ04_07721000 [Trypanosoma grayi]|uniref:hypothetical protein n=1 Tax=Trypanosoma grayi TaxID=71804 RepID=UPI0004F41B20|nr:hypothetical protein DQ04_07721000 [Trypanosoma grayi]KEG08212.1 hypothetical protein DQ04_07721000 [Trypanosoma grayi]